MSICNICNIVTCPVGARNPARRGGKVPAQDPVGHLLAIQKMNSVVEPYRLSKVDPKVSFLRFGRGLPINILTVLPQQTHLPNEPMSYLRGHGNTMPEAQNNFRDLFSASS